MCGPTCLCSTCWGHCLLLSSRSHGTGFLFSRIVFFFSLNLKCRRMFSILLILLVIYIIIAIIKSITVWFYSSHAAFFSGKDTVWFFLWLPVLTAVQVEAYNSQDDKAEMPIYNLPPKILCEVVYAQLKVYKYSFFFNRQFCKIKINKSKLDPEWCLT